MNLTERIAESRNLAGWLHERTDGRQFLADRRNQTALAILQLTLDISDGIAILLESKLPGPAFSLARPQFEGYVRGKWLLTWASDQRVLEFSKGRCPTFQRLLEKIPKNSESGGAWIHASAKANLSRFHDLTHGGSEHVHRRIGSRIIEPRYPEEESISLLKMSDKIRIRIGVELLSLFEDEAALQELSEKAKLVRKP